ncbi:MAG: hypothetical protein IKO52_16025 [Clostridia bacterium]|nr:hypothetical protein [Clostridia bacterium]
MAALLNKNGGNGALYSKNLFGILAGLWYDREGGGSGSSDRPRIGAFPTGKERMKTDEE